MREKTRMLGLNIVILLALGISLQACKSDPGSPPASGGGGTCTPSGLTSKLVVQPRKAYLPAVGHSKLVTHIPQSAARFRSDMGKMPEDETLSVTLELNLNNEEELDRQLRDIYTPGSASYHQFITPDEFRARYAPTPEQIDLVQSHLQSHGVTLASINDNGYLIHAEGTVAALNSMFQTEVHHYIDQGGNFHFAPSYELQVPNGVPIRAVHGLQNVTRWRTHSEEALVSPLRAGSGPGGGLSPADIRTAYSTPTSVTGAGQTLALFELDGYNASDVASYVSFFGLPSVPLQNVFVDGASGSAGAGAAEVILDIELQIALAPGAAKIMVYEGPNSEQGVLDTYARIANDNIAKQISTSWGAPENQSSPAFIQTENTIFKQMAAQGQTIYAAAGDSGAYDDGSHLGVDDPASQPYMVAVGGTKLFTTASGAYDHEVTWNTTGSPSGGGGGGGISSIWALPSYQSGIVPAASLGSQSKRNVPDVSLDSAPETGYSIFFNGRWSIFGGTSCASPLWAAYTALVNQQRQTNGVGPLRFANTILYKIGLSTRYTTDFSDIKDGSTNMHYPAVSGYDDATGLGSFKGQQLFNDLIQGSPSLPPGPPVQTGC